MASPTVRAAMNAMPFGSNQRGEAGETPGLFAGSVNSAEEIVVGWGEELGRKGDILPTS